MGLFIVFEGGEGSGKTTQIKLLHQRLSQLGIPTVATREPGSTVLGERISKLLKQKNRGLVSPQAELLLFASSRAELLTEVIRPNLKKGAIVLCDRYIYSTIAYQGYGRGLDLKTIQAINQVASQGLLPDLVVFMNILPEVGLARLKRGNEDRFEAEEITFHRRVRQGYLEMAAADRQRWLVVDATKPKQKVAEIIWERVERLLLERGMIKK